MYRKLAVLNYYLFKVQESMLLLTFCRFIKNYTIYLRDSSYNRISCRDNT